LPAVSDQYHLVQIPYSPFCLVQRRILEFAGARFRVVNVPNSDRSRVWRLTRQRYYAVPVLKHGRAVVFETDDYSQVIAKYLDTECGLGLFPPQFEGVQDILWRYFENEIEAVAFRLNDIYYRENLPRADWLGFIRHKERKFGRGCLDRWRKEQPRLLAELERRLVPCEQMLRCRPFLLDTRPLFVDFDLYGMLANFLYSGHYTLPDAHPLLRDWHARMTSVRAPTAARAKPATPRHPRARSAVRP
jgi:glutathione S-transferase